MLPFFHKSLGNKASEPGYLAFLAAIIAVLVLPVHNQYLPPFMIIWFLFWLLDFLSRKGNVREDSSDSVMLLCCFISLFLWLVSGLLYSENLNQGFLLISRKLSLILFPVILFSPGLEIKKRINFLLKAFTLGTVAFLLFCYCYALFRSVFFNSGQWTFNPINPEEPWINYFYGAELTSGQHPSYVAMYTVFSVFIAFEFFSAKTLKLSSRYVWLAIGLFLFISVYFLSSRAGFLATILVLPFYLVIKLGRQRLNIKSVALILFLIIGITSLYFLNQRVNYNVNISKIFETDSISITDDRTVIFRSAVNAIAKNPIFGTGVGDASDVLKTEFLNSGYTKGYNDSMNAHNQYLEYLLSSGVVGLLLFLAIIGVMIRSAIRNRNTLYAVFIIIIMVFFTFESMLNRLAGITYFSLFSFLLMHLKNAVHEFNEQDQAG